MEAGCGWVPSWLWRIEEHLELAGWKEAAELTMSATDYFKRNCWVTTECDEDVAYHFVEELGDDHTPAIGVEGGRIEGLVAAPKWASSYLTSFSGTALLTMRHFPCASKTR